MSQSLRAIDTHLSFEIYLSNSEWFCLSTVRHHREPVCLLLYSFILLCNKLTQLNSLKQHPYHSSARQKSRQAGLNSVLRVSAEPVQPPFWRLWERIHLRAVQAAVGVWFPVAAGLRNPFLVHWLQKSLPAPDTTCDPSYGLPPPTSSQCWADGSLAVSLSDFCRYLEEALCF